MQQGVSGNLRGGALMAATAVLFAAEALAIRWMAAHGIPVEVQVFARSLGLDDEQTLQVLKDSMAYSRIMDAKGGKMVQEDFEPHAKLSQHLKDVRLMLEAAAKTDTRLPLSETHRDILLFGERNGLGQLDNSAIIRAIELLRDGSH